MLFYAYASFRWARGRNYVVKTTALIMVLSVSSAVLGLMSTLLLGPFPFLSFPFYAEWGERRINLAQPFEFSDRIVSYEIRFATAPVFQLVPQGPVVQDLGDGMGKVQVVSYRIVLVDTEIGAIRPEFILITLFLFFLIVNAVEAVLGFSISKIRIIEKTELGSIGFWWRVTLGIVVLAFGVWLFTIGEVAQTSPSSRYYYSYNLYPYVYDAFAFVIFGIGWLVLMIAEKSLESNKNAWTFPSES